MVIQEYKKDKYFDIKEYIKNIDLESPETIYNINDNIIKKIVIIKPKTDECRYNFEIIKKNNSQNVFGYDLTFDFLKYVIFQRLDEI
ncbi:hypothetical protein EOM09_01925 [bacterium]|nr:hypothetical protein [bacterium]